MSRSLPIGESRRAHEKNGVHTLILIVHGDSLYGFAVDYFPGNLFPPEAE